MLKKLLRFSHSATYDVEGVGNHLRFSIPVWVLGDKQTLNVKSVIYEPGTGLGFMRIEAVISPVDDRPATNEKPETQEPPYSLK